MIDVAATRLPPTFWTMSAKTVVVVTTLMAAAAAVGGPPEPAAGEPAAGPQPVDASIASAAKAISFARPVVSVLVRLSLSNERTSFSKWWVSGGVSESVGGRRLRLAMAAETEQLEAMRLDRVAAPTSDLGDDSGEAAVLDPAGPTAAR